MLQCLVKAGISLRGNLYYYAGLNGQFDTIKWLRANNYPWREVLVTLPQQ